MKKFVLVGMVLLLCATSLDAAPRNRRRARRARRAATTQPVRNITNSNAIVTQSLPASFDTSLAMTQDQVTSEQQRILLASGPTKVPLVTAEQAIAEAEATVPEDNRVALVDDLLPIVDVIETAPLEEQASPSDAIPLVVMEPEPVNPALAELNMIRSRRGLFPLLEDRALTMVAHRKASIQASRGYMGHPGGTMGGARYEGVGMGNQFTTCYQDATFSRYAGAATVVGRNGQRYHCLLLR